MSGHANRPLDFFAAGVNLGFSTFEVSGWRHPAFYAEIHPGRFPIVSFHDPAPPLPGSVLGAVGSTMLRREDLVLTSLDEGRRRGAVAITGHTLEQAATYGASVIIVHAGQTGADPRLAAKLQALYLDHSIDAPEAQATREQLAAEIARDRQAHLEALWRSLDELVPAAQARSLVLGLENRPRPEIPSWEDMGEILARYPDSHLGYWHDTGHAQLQEDLGFTFHSAWLSAFRSRLVGLHLHDEVGLVVHRAPGAGCVNWAELIPLVADQVLRTIEVDDTVSPQALLAGVDYLRSAGWIERSHQNAQSQA